MGYLNTYKLMLNKFNIQVILKLYISFIFKLKIVKIFNPNHFAV